MLYAFGVKSKVEAYLERNSRAKPLTQLKIDYMTRFFSVLCFILLFSFNTAYAQSDAYKVHKIKEGETIESIAKRYYVTPHDIFQLNPDAKKELKVNDVLIIPKSKVQKPIITIVKELQGFKKHKTKRKETLFGLAKKYNVSIDDIKKHNKFLYAEPLRKGRKLQIPLFKTTEIEEVVELTKTYAVLAKEGKWRVAYKFNITIAELEALNPEMGDELKEGEVLNVPNIEDTAEKVIDETYSYYKVKPKEGFYRLKINLGIEQEELEALNPGLKESGLKNGMILKIPFNKMVDGIIEDDSDRINLADSISDYATKHIALMLPFRLNRVDFDSISGTKRSIKKDRYLDISLDFYSGVLMAIDSLKKQGVSLKVDVYDTRREVSSVMESIDNNNFENVDAVIGPLMSNTFNKVASELKQYNVPVVSPNGANSKLKLYNNVFLSKPADELLKAKIVNYVKTDTLSSNIIVIADSKNTLVANSLKGEFFNAKLIYSRRNKKNGKDEYYVIKEDIQDVLKAGNNIVFLETQNDGYASSVVSILASLIQEENEEEELEAINISLVTTKINSAFEGEEVNNTHLSKLQLTFASASKAYNVSDHNSFVKNYEYTYKTLPNSAAVKGFDLTMDVVLRLVSSEDLYMSVKNAPLTEYVENKFAYKRESFGGYYNDTVYLVKHQDLTIVEVKQ